MEYSESYTCVITRYFNSFIKKSSAIVKETLGDIGDGAVRSIVLIFPYVHGNLEPRYVKISFAYQKMFFEKDIRMLRAITSLIPKSNCAYEMVFTIINFIFSSMPERTKSDFSTRKEEVETIISDIVSRQAVKQATKIALIELMEKLISSRISNSSSVKLTAEKLSRGLITTFQIYSYSDKAVIAARKLKREHKIIYNFLYAKTWRCFTS